MSTVILDTITGKSTATTITIGSTPVVSSSANSMTIRGEGSNQTSIQQGLAKAWVNFNGTSTIATRDSFNTASLTDGGSGNYDVNWTNSFANTNYCHSGADGNYGMCNTEPQNLSTGEANVYSYNSSHALTGTGDNNGNHHPLLLYLFLIFLMFLLTILFHNYQYHFLAQLL